MECWIVDTPDRAPRAAEHVLTLEGNLEREAATRHVAHWLEERGDPSCIETLGVGGGTRLLGILLDATLLLGVDATRLRWRYGGPAGPDAVVAALGLPMEATARLAPPSDDERALHTLRIDLPGLPSPIHGCVAAFGAAATMLGEVERDGLSLLGLVRGATAMLQPERSDAPPGRLTQDGRTLAEDARILVASGLGLPPAIARWAGRGEPGAEEVRCWWSEIRLDNLGALLDGAPLRSAPLGELVVERARAFSLDGVWLEGEGLPVRLRPGPVLRVRLPNPL